MKPFRRTKCFAAFAELKNAEIFMVLFAPSTLIYEYRYPAVVGWPLLRTSFPDDGSGGRCFVTCCYSISSHIFGIDSSHLVGKRQEITTEYFVLLLIRPLQSCEHTDHDSCI